jgi:hypothetical protein
MDETNFLTLVYPEMVRTADGIVVRFFIWCEWRRQSSAGTGSLFALEQAFLEPQRPFSIMPHAFAQRHNLRLLPLSPDESGIPPQSGALGLSNATAQTAVLRFAEHHTAPDCPDESRTCGVVMWCQAAGASPAWVHPVLGADFLLEHRLRLFVDYGRLVHAPVGVGRVRFDSLVPCGYLENHGDEGPSDEPDPFAGFPGRPGA